MTGRRLLFVVNSAKYFLSHRLQLALAARDAGNDVCVAAPPEPESATIQARGFAFYPVPVRRGTVNPLSEAAAVAALIRLYRALRPNLVHHVTMKPVLYGTIAARLAGVPAIVNTVTGLGYLFVDGGARQRVLRTVFTALGRVAFHHPRMRFIFQNPDDLEDFLAAGLTTETEVHLIRGSGVDTTTFAPTPEPAGAPVVVLPSRMLWDKGVGEFVEAAGRLRAAGNPARFALVGDPDPANPRAVPSEQLRAWNDQGLIESWGYRSDMPAVFASCHVVTLPSVYREGVPKVLIEAASCGRPLVATDMPGCREIVRDGANGLLVPPRDAAALAAALERLIANPELRRTYGASGRALVEAEFAIEHVIARTFQVYGELEDAPHLDGAR
jgi:glycosyltransferase involved in cell wall biosynthesis